MDHQVAEELANKIWKTSKARAVSHNRLKWLDNYWLYTMTWYSVLLIISSIMSLLDSPPGIQKEHLPLLNLCFSIALMALSLIVANKKFGVASEKMHQCSQKLNHLYTSIRSYFTDSKYKIEKNIYDDFNEKYNKSIAGFDNHTTQDYLTVLISINECTNIQKRVYLKNKIINFLLLLAVPLFPIIIVVAIKWL